MKVNYKELTTLMAESQNGKEDSYTKLLIQISLIIDHILSKKINSSDEKDEILQEILTSVHHLRHTYLPNYPFFPWMHGILTNVLSRYYKRIIKTDINKYDGNMQTIFKTCTKISSVNVVQKFNPREQFILTHLKDQKPLKQVFEDMNTKELNFKVTVYRLQSKMREVCKNET
jgi:DNA-directed RNA polymerase specialized sigma24 family protein